MNLTAYIRAVKVCLTTNLKSNTKLVVFIFLQVMFQKIRKYIFTEEKVPMYKPVRHTFFRDPKIADILHNEGYYIADFLEE